MFSTNSRYNENDKRKKSNRWHQFVESELSNNGRKIERERKKTWFSLSLSRLARFLFFPSAIPPHSARVNERRKKMLNKLQSSEFHFTRMFRFIFQFDSNDSLLIQGIFGNVSVSLCPIVSDHLNKLLRDSFAP